MPRAKDVWFPLLVIHAAMMSTVILYGVIAYAIGGEPAHADHGTLLAVLAGAAAATAVASFVARAALLPPRERAGDGRSLDESLLATPAARAALARTRAALIVGWALCEAVALFGLVLAILDHDAAAYAPFGAASLVLFFLHSPRPRLLVEIANALPR